MKRASLAGAMAVMAAVGSLAAPAFAADLARPATVAKAPAMVPAPVFSWTGFYIGANAGYGWGSGTGLADAYGVSPQGWFGGGQVGVNYQFQNNIVAGLEADVDGGDISGNALGLSSKLDTFGTVRARLGYAFGRVLPYVTGGFAWGSNTLDYGALSQSQTHTGWTAGAGLEYALTDHWTAKTEYLYTDLGSKYYDIVGADSGLTNQAVRLGVNYKF